MSLIRIRLQEALLWFGLALGGLLGWAVVAGLIAAYVIAPPGWGELSLIAWWNLGWAQRVSALVLTVGKLLMFSMALCWISDRLAATLSADSEADPVSIAEPGQPAAS